MDLVVKKALEALAQLAIYSYNDVEALYLTIGSLDKTIEIANFGSSNGLSMSMIISVINLVIETNNKPVYGKPYITSSTPTQGNFWNDMWKEASNNLAKDLDKKIMSWDQETKGWPKSTDFNNHRIQIVLGPKGTKVSDIGKILTMQEDEAHPNGWYYFDLEGNIVFHLPPPVRVIKDFKMTHVSLELDDITVAGTINHTDDPNKSDSDEDWPAGPLPPDQEDINAKNDPEETIGHEEPGDVSIEVDMSKRRTKPRDRKSLLLQRRLKAKMKDDEDDRVPDEAFLETFGNNMPSYPDPPKIPGPVIAKVLKPCPVCNIGNLSYNADRSKVNCDNNKCNSEFDTYNFTNLKDRPKYSNTSNYCPECLHDPCICDLDDSKVGVPSRIPGPGE